MKLLGIDSSSLVASVAVVTDDVLTAEYTVDFKKTHSQTLLPMIDEVVTMPSRYPAALVLLLDFGSAVPPRRGWGWLLRSL